MNGDKLNDLLTYRDILTMGFWGEREKVPPLTEEEIEAIKLQHIDYSHHDDRKIYYKNGEYDNIKTWRAIDKYTGNKFSEIIKPIDPRSY